MVDRVQEFTDLEFNPQAMFNISRNYVHSLKELVERPPGPSSEDGKEPYRGWGVGPIVDSFAGGQLLTGSKVRTPGQYITADRVPDPRVNNSKTTDQKAKKPTVFTCEYIHPVVAHASDKTIGTGYKSEAMLGFDRTPRGKGLGHDWILEKKADVGWSSYLWGTAAKTEEQQNSRIVIPEFVIPAALKSPKRSMERWLILRADDGMNDPMLMDEHWEPGRMTEVKPKIVRRTTAVDFLTKLDQDNRLVNGMNGKQAGAP